MRNTNPSDLSSTGRALDPSNPHIVCGEAIRAALEKKFDLLLIGGCASRKNGIFELDLRAAHRFGVTAKELSGTGIGFSSMLAGGYTIRELLEAGHVPDASASPEGPARDYSGLLASSVEQMFGSARQATVDRAAFTRSLGILRQAGLGAGFLLGIGVRPVELRLAGYGILELEVHGVKTCEIREAGFSATEFRERSYTAAAAAGFSGGALAVAGYSLQEMAQTEVGRQWMLGAGLTVRQLRDADPSISLGELKKKGYTVEQMLDAGVAPETIARAGLD